MHSLNSLSNNFDSTYIVVGTAPWDIEGADHSLDFIINTPDDLVQLKKDWLFTEKAPNIFDQNAFRIEIIKNKVVVSGGLINPAHGSIIGDDGFYSFNENILHELHRSHEFRYKFQKLTFNTVEEYNSYRDSVLPLSSLVFITRIGKVYAGEFTVTVKKSSTTGSPAAAIAILSKQILTYASKDEFRAFHRAKDDNTAHRNDVIRITIACSKNVYDKFANDSYEVGEWKPVLINATSFWKP